MRAVLSSLREWWPELIAIGTCTLIAVSQNIENALAVVVAGVIFWAMGHRHRALPLHRKVDRMTDSVGEMVDEIRGQEAPATGRPNLTVHKGGVA